jgi:hypothetical protein
MSTTKHTYCIEVYAPGLSKWVMPHGTDCPKMWGEGYLYAVADEATPRLAHRLVRSDGKVVMELAAVDKVSIGMVAGWPMWSQYAMAAKDALVRAGSIAMQRKPTKIDTGGKLHSLAIAVQDVLDYDPDRGV